MTSRWRRPASGGGHSWPPFALPAHLAEAGPGLLVLRPGPAGPDITDVNRVAADLLGRSEAGLLGTLVEECPCLGDVPGLPEAVERVSCGAESPWHATHAASSGNTLRLTLRTGPREGSALLRLDPASEQSAARLPA